MISSRFRVTIGKVVRDTKRRGDDMTNASRHWLPGLLGARAALRGWVRFYPDEQPHRGYRTHGRCPAAILYRDRHELLSQHGCEPYKMAL